MKKEKLSLEQFKAKAEISNQFEELEKISGGILGACHCVEKESCGSFLGITICRIFTICCTN